MRLDPINIQSVLFVYFSAFVYLRPNVYFSKYYSPNNQIHSMNTKLEILRELLDLFKFSIYPLLELYGYFVFIGLFCLQNSTTNAAVLIILFILYHILLTNKMIYFMQLYIKDGSSTQELFPHTQKIPEGVDYEHVNPFVKQNILEKNIQKSQFCEICQTFKPPRCHHCSKCNRCLLKFDHHCYMLDTCIGFHNYKFFIQFLNFNILGSILFIVVIAYNLNAVAGELKGIFVNFIIGIILYAILLVLSTIFFIFHIRLASRNETTIEYFALNAYVKGDHSYIHVFQEGPTKNFVESTDRAVLNPYNLGIKENLKEVFGDGFLCWLSPTFTSKGNGIKFKTNDFDSESEEI